MIVSEDKTSGRGRRVLTGMIVSTRVLDSIASKWPSKGSDGLFQSRWENLVASWAVKFYEQFGKAPGSEIEGLFQQWAETARDKNQIQLVEKFLSALDGEYTSARKKLNPDYLIDLAGKHFNEVKAKKLAEQIQAEIDAGRGQEALKKIASFDQVEVGAGGIVDVFQDHAAIRQMLSSTSEPPLIEIPGDYGKFWGRTLIRGGFVSFMGRSKIGKSWWLVDLAYRCAVQRKRTLFFQIGDMTQDDMMERFVARGLGRPILADTWPLTVEIPVSWEGKNAIKKTKTFQSPPSEKEVLEVTSKMRERIKSQNPYLKLIVYPNDSVGVADLRSDIRRLDKAGWSPDCIVIDYADLLTESSRFAESRDASNSNWKALRKMSQELKALVITATQTNAASFTAESMNMTHFSNDRRKFDHVTAMIGISQKEEEQESQVVRLNYVNRRKGRYAIRRSLYCAGCLDLANPCVISTFG